MLDSDLIEQLKSVFSNLKEPLELKITGPLSDANKQNFTDLAEMVQGLANANPLLKVTSSGQSQIPTLEIYKQNKFTGIRFMGAPGGHEFSSLVLAVLNSQGLGKLPDEGILSRIKNLKGPAEIRTFVSLSCENCPDVVQALNLVSSINEKISHTTIDGAVWPEEVQKLGVQGVPAVFIGSKLISSGKSHLATLLATLEAELGSSQSSANQSKDLGAYDVVVLGGGPAGASAAIYSARKGLSVAIAAERIGGQLMDTLGIENMISTPYTEGKKLAADLAKHVSTYPVKIFEHRKVSSLEKASAPGSIHTVTFDSGEKISAKTIILATGARWRTLNVPGEKEHIGAGVAFCAHCDGPFYKGKRVVVVGGGNSGVEAALDLSALATHVTLLEFAPELKADSVLVEKLKKTSNAEIITQAQTQEVIGESGKVVGLKFLDRSSNESRRIDTDGVFVQIGLVPNTQFLKGLIELTPYGEIVVDAKGRTSAAGIYAAGDATTIPFKQIIMAMGDGAKAALSAFEDRMKSVAP